MSETTLKNKICEKSKLVSNLILVRRMSSGNNAGEPDIFGCFNGQHVEIEVKIGKNQPTKLQYDRMDEWKKFTQLVGCVWSTTDVYYLLKGYCITNKQEEELKNAFFREFDPIKLYVPTHITGHIYNAM